MSMSLNKKMIAATAGLMMAVAVPVAGFAGDTIKMGVVGPHSGDLASYGLPSVNAAKIVIEQINAAGGINGKKMNCLSKIRCVNLKTATDVATKLVSDGARVVLGDICSGATKAALPIYNRCWYTCHVSFSNEPWLTQSGDYPNFFRTIAPDDAQAQLDVDFASRHWDIRKLLLFMTKVTMVKDLLNLPRNTSKKTVMPKWYFLKV